MNKQPLKLFFKYASRSRPKAFFRGLDSIIELSNDKENFHILATLDEDDASMVNHPKLKEYEKYCTFIFGRSKNKIDAVNRDLDSELVPEWNILINMSDDVQYIKQGFDDIIRNDMARLYPDLDGVLHYHDGNNKVLMTMSVYGRKYFDRFGYIYHKDYESVYADNEAMDVANGLGKMTFLGEEQRIYNHLHPAYRLAAMDEQYKKTEAAAVFARDKATYERRKAIRFELDIKPRLSVLIPTMDKRKALFDSLAAALLKQVHALSASMQVEIIKNSQPGTIGAKRNLLLDNATGEYVCFIDDDDTISEHYLERILQAIKQDADCVALTGKYFVNGKYDRPFYHSLRHNKYHEDAEGYYRYPNHLNPIKASIAKQFRFAEKNHGEDTEWATAIHNAGALKSEAIVPEVLYYYRFVPRK